MASADPSDGAMIRLLMELRGRGIADQDVLSAIERTPRAQFVAPNFLPLAHDDTTLPIECGQTISQPFVVALMTEQLDVHSRHRVLEVGTGSGYQAAILSRLCRMVYSIERFRTLSNDAKQRFADLGLTNVVTRIGDGALGWPEQAPFDRIMVTAAAPEMPMTLIGQLRIGGIMVVPVGPDLATQHLLKVTRTEQGHETKVLSQVRFVPLVSGPEMAAEDRKSWRSAGAAAVKPE
jgi:protein-L-isoaspartate(D-aspartate) O-methyltransferase